MRQGSGVGSNELSVCVMKDSGWVLTLMIVYVNQGAAVIYIGLGGRGLLK